ncbi:hypothetical protein SAMN05518849_10226 [Sphingobium sp. AP50]|nr:hypothetical protein SAMN05518849_10226 [Sphingobium sp. AP50]
MKASTSANMASALTTSKFGRAARLTGKGRPPPHVPPANMPWGRCENTGPIFVGGVLEGDGMKGGSQAIWDAYT